LPVEINHKV